MKIDMRTYVLHNPEDFEGGGYVSITCECGFQGFVEVDDTGEMIRGNCADCDLAFEGLV